MTAPAPGELGASRRAPGGSSEGAGLQYVSIGDSIPADIRSTLERIAAQPYVRSVLVLPDVHHKAGMEVPSSLAITTEGVVVPEFTSVAVNDGMGVIQTGLSEADLTPARIEAFFRGINAHAAGHFFDTNRYSIDDAHLRRVVFEGAGALAGRYEFEPDVVSAMEDDGRMALPGPPPALESVVPHPLLTRFSRSEMGLNFGGNHFLELQVVDDLADAELAGRWGFTRGQVVVMYHLGPGPFGGTLLNHFAWREKLQPGRRPLFLASKLWFHYVQRAGRGGWSAKWPTYFRRNGWTPLPADGEEGLLLRQAFAMAINFGYGYRLATMAAIRDALRETISSRLEFRVFCDISHNGVTEDTRDGLSWVARHNACRLHPGRPTIVAGSYDVPSYIGLGGSESPLLHSYDHGAGHLIDRYRAEGRLAEASGSVARWRLTRGRSARVVQNKMVPLKRPEPIDRLMEGFAQHGMMRPVVRLRPIGNLKNG